MKLHGMDPSSIIEKIQAAIVVCRNDLHIDACNTAASLLFGGESTELIGKNFFGLKKIFLQENGIPFLPEQLPPAVAAAEARPVLDVTVGIRVGESGHAVWTRMSAQPDLDAAGSVTGVIVTLLDISDTVEKSKIDRRIKQAKDEWETTIDAINDFVVILDAEMNIIRANKAAYTLASLRFGELVGKKCHQILNGIASPCPGCPSRDPGLKAGGGRSIVYSNLFQKTFEVSFAPIYDESGRIKYLVHTGRDVTQKLKDESEKMRLSAAIEQLSEVVVITGVDGNIQYVNPAFTVKTGYSRSEVIGKNSRILKSGEHSPEFYQGLWKTLLAGKIWNGQFINKKKDGTLFWEDAAISPIRDGNKQITNFIAVKRDITKEKSLEGQLRQAMKMEAIGTLAGGVAHDFNNILSVMIGYGQMAKGRLRADDPAVKDIDEILLAGDRAVDLVKQILTFSRQDTHEQFKPLKIQYLIKEVLKLLRSSMPATIELASSIRNDCRSIMADSSQIHQVLMNLCTNAKQAIGGGYGKITVNLSEVVIEEDSDICPGLANYPADYVVLEVSDNGCGMSKKLQERIFEPFFTTKPKDHGTGLGLAVVHGIVKKHGGVIQIASKVGEGTTFRIYFPAQMGEVEDEREQYGLEYRGTGRIMVVDDEKTIAKVYARMLEKLGYRVVSFTDSIEAASVFRKNPDQFDLIVTDMTMPKMTGAELAREVLALRPGFPVILTTGYSEIIDKERAKGLGVREFLLKPVKKEKLSQVVCKALENG